MSVWKGRYEPCRCQVVQVTQGTNMHFWPFAQGAVSEAVLAPEQIYILFIGACSQWESLGSCALSCIRVRADLYTAHGSLGPMGELETSLALAPETYFGQQLSFSALEPVQFFIPA